jgi:preprotein translocase subunit SecG
MYTFLLALLLLDALILTTSVLLQAGQGGGLASLGGGAGTDMFMGGRQTVTLLTKLSWWCAGIFLFLALMLAFMSSHNGGPRSVIEGNVQAPAPVQSSPLPLQSTPATGTPAQQTPAPTPHP